MARQDRVTIEDVAKLSGVSRGTVSRVLNGSLNVRPATRKQILDVIERLEYQPSVHARRTAGAKAYTVSVILPMIETEFYVRLVEGIERKLRSQWHAPVISPVFSREPVAWLRRPDIPAYDADGIILCSLVPERLFPSGHFPTGRPAVLVDSHSPAYDSVYLDNEYGGYLAGHRLAQGEGDIHVISMREYVESPLAGVFRHRLQGFRRALEEAGRELPDDRVHAYDFSWSAGCLATRDILQRSNPPVNIFALCDLFALGVVEEAARTGLDIGESVRIVGFDDHSWTAELGLTTVHQPIEEMGETAAGLLLERLNGDKSPVREVRFTPELVVRKSA